MKDSLNLKFVFLIVILGVIVYFNSLWVNFIWDDTSLILDNPLIKNFSKIFGIFTTNLSPNRDIFYRPIQNLTYMLDFFLYKFDYKGYHLTNIILHIITAILSYKLLLTLTKNNSLSFCASLLYLVSPLWVETVTYISGRADILMAVFIILSFIFFIKDKILFSLILYLLSLLSKEASLIYPLVLLLYLSLFRIKGKKTIYALIAFFILTTAYLGLRFVVLKNVDIVSYQYPLYIRILFFIKALGRYIGLILLPINQHMSYTVSLPASLLDKEVLLSLSVWCLLIFLFFYFLKRKRYLSFFIGWFFIMLIPNSGIFPLNAFFAEHFIYLSSIGIFLLLVYFLQKLKPKLLFNVIFFGYLSFFSLATIRYNFIWQDEVRFYTRITKLSPNSFSAYNNLGVIYLNQGNLEEGEKFIKKSLEINPKFQEARLNLSRFYYLKQDYPRAIGLAKAVLEEDPKNFWAADFLGTFYFKEGQADLAEVYYKKALNLNPDYIPGWLDLYKFYKSLGREKELQGVKENIERIDRYSLSGLYFEEAKELWGQGNTEEALILVNQALGINPLNSNYYNLKGCILRKKGDYLGALNNFQKARRISPQDPQVYNNLGNLFAVVGDFKNAEINFRKVISLNKNFADAYFNLGLLYFERQDFKEAEKFFRETISLNSSHLLAKEYLRKIRLNP